MTELPQHSVVWSEIPVRDLDKASAFYQAATGHPLTKTEMGGQDIAILGAAKGGVGANLVVGTPAAPGSGPVLHLACAGALADIIARTEGAGGQITSPVIPIPEGQFVYAQDPDGNRIGLFEAK